MTNFLEIFYSTQILGGTVAGLVSALVFFLIFRLVHTKIRIAEHISVMSKKGEREIIRCKLINLRFRKALDVSVEVFLEYREPGGVNRVKTLVPIGEKQLFSAISKRRFKDKECDNAFRVQISRAALVEALALHPNGNLRVEVYSRDAVSGINKIKERTFAPGLTDFIHGEFGSGRLLEIVPVTNETRWKIEDDILAFHERHGYDQRYLNLSTNLARYTVVEAIVEELSSALAPTRSQAKLSLSKEKLGRFEGTLEDLTNFKVLHGGIDGQYDLIRARSLVAKWTLATLGSPESLTYSDGRVDLARATLQIALESAKRELLSVKSDEAKDVWQDESDSHTA